MIFNKIGQYCHSRLDLESQILKDKVCANKKGAMFGLDARIALAIFGALSVISGAALYSAIQQAKVVALLSEGKEVVKAYEAYYLDTGVDLEPSLDSSYALIAGSLVSSSTHGFKGPYIALDMHSDNNHSLVSAIYPGSKVHIYLLKDSEALGGSDNVGVDHKCLSSDECSTWLRYDNVPYNLMSKLDIMLDGTDNAAEGKFRYNQRTDDETLSRMFLKINKQF